MLSSDVRLVQEKAGISSEEARKLLLKYDNDVVECLLHVAPTSRLVSDNKDNESQILSDFDDFKHSRGFFNQHAISNNNSNNQQQQQHQNPYSYYNTPVGKSDAFVSHHQQQQLQQQQQKQLSAYSSPVNSPPQEAFSLKSTPTPAINSPSKLLSPLPELSALEKKLLSQVHASMESTQNKRLRREIDILKNEKIVLKRSLERTKKEINNILTFVETNNISLTNETTNQQQNNTATTVSDNSSSAKLMEVISSFASSLLNSVAEAATPRHSSNTTTTTTTTTTIATSPSSVNLVPLELRFGDKQVVVGGSLNELDLHDDPEFRLPQQQEGKYFTLCLRDPEGNAKKTDNLLWLVVNIGDEGSDPGELLIPYSAPISTENKRRLIFSLYKQTKKIAFPKEQTEFTQSMAEFVAEHKLNPIAATFFYLEAAASLTCL